MKPPFSVINQHYPAKESREVLFTEIGWTDLIDNKAFWDTCAIRMSYALRLSSVPFASGSWRAKAGKIKGKAIQIRQADLSRELKRLWGAHEIYKGGHEARNSIGNRKGVVSFFRIEGGSGGHIDLVSLGPDGFQRCARACAFTALTISFWELP